ncbi:Tyrosine-protein kinase YwqD [Poriferisphaera corsica]|uniref:non-specific protein-tyrosine kinase n=1 Tax=Poriferisphaera corsica TaxID=2528020 RepID=A0A517YUX2_9BACT|nr:CpsD/CapB family tyrosine-protein kinase [Poriferisphaera corsica]QDU34005.1 Tyrosine-protein kinase YwqD [Poriferisphaera corsica]
MGYIFDALKRNKQPEDKLLASEDTTARPSDETCHEINIDDVETLSACRDDLEEAVAAEAFTASDNLIIEATPEWINCVDDRLIALREPGAVMSEEYRSIRTSLLARWNHEKHLVHTITSATPQEGKTITSLNLGLSFAELHNRKVIVIEADLRLPTFEKLLHLGTKRGLVGYLRGEYELDEIVHELSPNGLFVIPAGGRANNDSVQMLSSKRMQNLLEHLRTSFDHVIIDTPPVIELADAGILGSQSDDVILIARMSRTPRALIDQAKKVLSSYNAPVSGMIATDQKRSRHKHYYYRYGYGYRYHNRYYTKQAA